MQTSKQRPKGPSLSLKDFITREHLIMMSMKRGLEVIELLKNVNDFMKLSEKKLEKARTLSNRAIEPDFEKRKSWVFLPKTVRCPYRIDIQQKLVELIGIEPT